MNYEIVKLHFDDIYDGWMTKEPDIKSDDYDFGYFIKIDGHYFRLGVPSEDGYYVVENN